MQEAVGRGCARLEQTPPATRQTLPGTGGPVVMAGQGLSATWRPEWPAGQCVPGASSTGPSLVAAEMWLKPFLQTAGATLGKKPRLCTGPCTRP